MATPAPERSRPYQTPTRIDRDRRARQVSETVIKHQQAESGHDLTAEDHQRMNSQTPGDPVSDYPDRPDIQIEIIEAGKQAAAARAIVEQSAFTTAFMRAHMPLTSQEQVDVLPFEPILE